LKLSLTFLFLCPSYLSRSLCQLSESYWKLAIPTVLLLSPSSNVKLALYVILYGKSDHNVFCSKLCETQTNILSPCSDPPGLTYSGPYDLSHLFIYDSNAYSVHYSHTGPNALPQICHTHATHRVLCPLYLPHTLAWLIPSLS
jgi:hypothetical protein